jgi:glycosyltransferase involved in cell wall biosynthesis
LLRDAPPAASQRTTVLPLGDPTDQGGRYARSWVTALPSVYDSFGLVLVESLASGTPIVVANHAAPPELAQPGVGTICTPDDAPSLAEALRAGLDLAAHPETASRCRAAAAAYDWDAAIAPLLEEIYAG